MTIVSSAHKSEIPQTGSLGMIQVLSRHQARSAAKGESPNNYLGTEKTDVELQAKYREHIVTILNLAQIADAETKAARIYDLEKMIATVHASRTESADIQKANNPWASKDFPGKAPGIDWATFFKAAGLFAQPTIVVWHPGAVTGISALVANQPLDVWKEYLTFRVI